MHFRKSGLRKISLGLIIAVSGGTSQAVVPNDLLYSDPNTPNPANNLPIDYQWGLEKLNLEPAWDLARGHAYLSLIDTGIQVDHPDLIANFRPRFSNDFASNDPNDTNVDELVGENFTVAGHGTHVAGIMAAETNNGIGTAGVCWHCSLMVAKRLGSSTDVVKMSTDSLNWVVNNGAQAINLSWGDTRESFLSQNVTCDTIPTDWPINNDPDQQAAINFCNALAHAEEFDVVMVAASGNGVRTAINEIHFPASDPRTIAVGAVDILKSASPNVNSIAVDTVVPIIPNHAVYIQFNKGPEKDLVAPGFNILSTFYKDQHTSDQYEEGYANPGHHFHPECADYIDASTISTPLDSSGEPQPLGYTGPRPGGDGYGPCSGTSMAAPHVTGLVGLLRSINPLLKKDQIKAALINHASVDADVDPNPDPDVYGHGMPDALASVQDVLGKSNGAQLNNRLTPLFTLISTSGQDYFYTTKPQMAMAAIHGAMQPQPQTGQVNWYSTGQAVPGYSSFPKPGFWWTEKPRASVYIFTTHNDPHDEGREIVPLYRLSYQGQHGSNSLNVDHTYTTDQAGVTAYENVNYELDGIEGYIYSKNEEWNPLGPPPGTVKLYRKYNPTRDDHAIFPESQLSYMTSQGYTQNDGGSEWIGYVYPNIDSDWDGVINGFEDILGTDSFDSDSDDDGISDGIEVNNYPYSDPMVP